MVTITLICLVRVSAEDGVVLLDRTETPSASVWPVLSASWGLLFAAERHQVVEHCLALGSSVALGERRRAFLTLQSAHAWLVSSLAFGRAGNHGLCWPKSEAGIFP